jgi:ribosomal protein S18 acetylase RimI-like enzyme
MIMEIHESDFDVFFDLMGEVECGNQFNAGNPDHVEWLKKKIAEYFYRGARFFAYYLDNRTPVGFATLLIDRQLFHFDQKSELLAIGVFPEFRKKGYGTELLKHAEEISRQSGVYCMFMATYAGAQQVISFYGKSGFIPVATLPDVHGPKAEGTVFMRKTLQ